MFSRLITRLPAQQLVRQIQRLTPQIRVSSQRYSTPKPPRSTNRNIQKLLLEKKARGRAVAMYTGPFIIGIIIGCKIRIINRHQYIYYDVD